MAGVQVRVGEERDVSAVRETFLRVYRDDYPYRHFFDEHWLKRSVFSDDIVMLVAESEDGGVIGTASVLLDIGAHSDLIGEFGRLAVHPDARGAGVGGALMRARVTEAERRLHIAVVEARTAHTFSQKIALRHGFVPVGYLPQKHRLKQCESVVLLVRHFGAALELRRNNPRVVPEVKALARLALQGSGLADDAIVDDASAAYPAEGAFDVETLTAERLSPLLRIERGRAHQREVFGPTTLQHGFFKISANNADYLVARRQKHGEIAGAVGFIRDPIEQTIRVLELVHSHEAAARFLLARVLTQAEAWQTRYVEIDVSAHATCLQRTLIELGFVPAAYLPAMVFSDVERLDVVRFVYLDPSSDVTKPVLDPRVQPLAEHVSAEFTRGHILPELRRAFSKLQPFEGLSEEQLLRLEPEFRIRNYPSNQTVFQQSEPADGLHVVLSGEITIERDGAAIGAVSPGGLLGEFGAISGAQRSATARAAENAQVGFLERERLNELVRRRPDIGVVLYRNLALGLGKKLRERKSGGSTLAPAHLS